MRAFIAFLLVISLASCKNDTVSPTGSLLITVPITAGTSASLPSYTLYTELGYQRGISLQAGPTTYFSSTAARLTLTDLNEGNYVIAFASSSSGILTRSVQVTAGRQREYTF